MKRLAILIIAALAAITCSAQSCTPGGGVTCTPNLNLWLPPLNYTNWNVPLNANATTLDTWSATVLLKAGGTMTGPLYLSADPTTSTQAATKNYVDAHAGGGGTVTSFAAPSASWPTWLVPTVATATTTPSLTVAASAIPNSALQNATLTLGSTTLTLGATTTAVTGLTIDGVLPATMAFVDPTSSIQTQLNAKAAKGANSDITSLSGLTTPLTVGQGGIGVAGGTGYAYGNGLASFTFSTTIPVASVTGAAPTASPTFTGTVTMPFVTAGLVQTNASGVISTSGIPLTGSGVAVPTGPSSTTANDIVTFLGAAGQLQDSGILLTTLAPLASPTFTGTPAAPTAALNTNTTQIATTAYVTQELPVMTDCGSTTTCTPTVLTAPLIFVHGTVTLSGGTATITSVPNFSSTSTSACSCEDSTVPTSACEAHLASVSSIDVNGTTTDTVQYECRGN